MTRLSKYPLTADVWEQITGDFYGLISSLSETNEIKSFFDDFFTQTERVIFAKRFAIALMLSTDFSYEDISRILKVSPTTIFFIQQSLTRSKIYKQVIKKTINRKNTQEFIENLKETLKLLKPHTKMSDFNTLDLKKINETEVKSKTFVWETTSRTRENH